MAVPLRSVVTAHMRPARHPPPAPQLTCTRVPTCIGAALVRFRLHTTHSIFTAAVQLELCFDIVIVL